MKTIKTIFFTVLIFIACFFLSTVTTFAEDTIKVGYYSDFTDFIFDIESKNNKGYGYEIFEKIEEVSDLEFEYIRIDGNPTDALNAGIIDLICFNTKTEAKQEEMLFSKTIYGKTYIALMTENTEIYYADAKSIDGKTVATYENNIGINDLNRFCDNYGIDVEYIYGEVHNYMDLDADFYISLSEDRSISKYNNVLNLGVHGLYVNASFENQELLDLIDKIFIDIVKTEGNFFLELEKKYLAGNLEINHRDLTSKEVVLLRQKTLEVGYIEGYAPISYTNEDGQAAGAMIDTLDYLAEQYKFNVNYTPYSIYDDPELLTNFDVLVALYGDGESNYKYYSPTESYFSMPMIAQINPDMYDSSNIEKLFEQNLKIGSLKYQTIDYFHFLNAYPDSEFIFYDDWHELLDSFENNEIGMFISSETAATYAEIYLQKENIVMLHTDINTPINFLINKNIEDEYMKIFNVMLDRISETEYRAIIERNANEFLPEQDVSLLEFLRNRWYLAVIGVLSLIICFSALVGLSRRDKLKALEKAYNTDSLTGLMTMNKFRDTIENILLSANPSEYELISLDIDMFKTINTHYSSERGNAVLVAIAEILIERFQNTSAIISRKSADQFVIFRKINDGGFIRQIYSDNILPAIRSVIGKKYNLSMSFGTVIIKKCDESGTTLIGQADNARLRGKSEHRTTFITFDDKMQKYYEDKINITFRMEQAMKSNEFKVEYQPKINLKTLKMSGAEALVRWNPKFGEKIFPDQFIPVFEENGFISYLDLHVLELVCKFIKTNKFKLNIPCISVNLSSHTVLTDNIVSKISDIISIYGISSNQIELELTESAIEANPKKFLSTVKQLKDLGFSIAIDDFGAGVSSLNRLSMIEAHVLKLDKAFLDENERMGKSMIVVSDMVRMAKRLTMKVVAEGVETLSQTQWLKNINCDYAQGYFFSKPLNEELFKEFILSDKQFSIEDKGSKSIASD